VLLVATAVTGTFGDMLPRFPARTTAIFALAAATAAGLGIRELRRRLQDSAARLRRSAQEHQAATQRAIEAERARIASELHDVVTHNVSVMVVQAGAARKVLASSPGDAEEALLAVEASGRTAMAELRSLLGLLSPPADGTCDAVLHPQPGLAELDALIGRVSAAGLPVNLRVSGEPRPLPPGADLAAYRVVQEALTNVLRHAGESAASVRATGAAVDLRRETRRRPPARRRLAAAGRHASGACAVRVVIADDQALVRGGFRLILKVAGIEVAAEAADGAQAVAAVLEHLPDVVLMDIRMPGLDGIEATRRILAAGPTVAGVRIIILTTFDLDRYVYAALAAGASGFLLKDVTPEHLVAAVQLVQTGDALLAPSITRRLVEHFAPGSRPTSGLAPGSPTLPGRDLSAP
jgi:DNA-binding NarL/FixJ family response regulator